MEAKYLEVCHLHQIGTSEPRNDRKLPNPRCPLYGPSRLSGRLIGITAIEGQADHLTTSGDPGRVVLNGRASQTCQLERIAGCSIIGESRGSSAHLHRPWRAILPPLRIKLRTRVAGLTGGSFAAAAFDRLEHALRMPRPAVAKASGQCLKAVLAARYERTRYGCANARPQAD
jgi:hypothetical protein